MDSNTFINQIMKDKYTYSEIVAVGRKLRRYENILNNLAQFKQAFQFVIGDDSESNVAFNNLEGVILKLVARYRAMYDNMLKTLNS